jgi:hypothetical protein
MEVASAGSRRRSAILRAALGVAIVSAVAPAGAYWWFNRASTQLTAPSEPPRSAASPTSEVETKPVSADLTVGVPPRPIEPVDRAVPPLPATTREAEPAASTTPTPISEPPAAKPAVGPRDDVYRVRFDSKAIGLTPTGLRALEAALRAHDTGHKVRIAIEGCEAGEIPAAGGDCADLIRRLKWILADRGVEHPAALIANPH